jgi:Secretion system C-terminal sorting domain
MTTLVLLSDEFIVYPNPSREEVLIQFSQPRFSDLRYDLIDANGRRVNKGSLNNYRINLKRIGAGIYFIRNYENNRLIGKTNKIIKL